MHASAQNRPGPGSGAGFSTWGSVDRQTKSSLAKSRLEAQRTYTFKTCFSASSASRTSSRAVEDTCDCLDSVRCCRDQVFMHLPERHRECNIRVSSSLLGRRHIVEIDSLQQIAARSRLQAAIHLLRLIERQGIPGKGTDLLAHTQQNLHGCVRYLVSRVLHRNGRCTAAAPHGYY